MESLLVSLYGGMSFVFVFRVKDLEPYHQKSFMSARVAHVISFLQTCF